MPATVAGTGVCTADICGRNMFLIPATDACTETYATEDLRYKKFYTADDCVRSSGAPAKM